MLTCGKRRRQRDTTGGDAPNTSGTARIGLPASSISATTPCPRSGGSSYRNLTPDPPDPDLFRHPSGPDRSIVRWPVARVRLVQTRNLRVRMSEALARRAGLRQVPWGPVTGHVPVVGSERNLQATAWSDATAAEQLSAAAPRRELLLPTDGQARVTGLFDSRYLKPHITGIALSAHLANADLRRGDSTAPITWVGRGLGGRQHELAAPQNGPEHPSTHPQRL